MGSASASSACQTPARSRIAADPAATAEARPSKSAAGAISGARASTTTTAIPARASRHAAASPTGPPPTMSMSAIRSRRASASLGVSIAGQDSRGGAGARARARSSWRRSARRKRAGETPAHPGSASRSARRRSWGLRRAGGDARGPRQSALARGCLRAPGSPFSADARRIRMARLGQGGVSGHDKRTAAPRIIPPPPRR